MSSSKNKGKRRPLSQSNATSPTHPAARADFLLDAANDHQNTLISIYFALGMKVGARLSRLLYDGFDKDY